MKERDEGISRRRALKRIGAGMAIAWTAPILTSVRTPAFAQYGCGCPPLDCLSPQLCDNGCICAPRHGNGGPCACFDTPVCNVGQGPICEDDLDCGLNGVCVDVNPNCGCDGNVACGDAFGCLSGGRRRVPFKGIRKL